jgi:hypothetical protein
MNQMQHSEGSFSLLRKVVSRNCDSHVILVVFLSKILKSAPDLRELVELKVIFSQVDGFSGDIRSVYFLSFNMEGVFQQTARTYDHIHLN